MSLFKGNSRLLAAGVAASALFLSATVQAASVTVDGNLTDLLANSANPNFASFADQTGDGENGNGFDITNVYSFFSLADDVLYLGFETAGPVGQACNNSNAGLCLFAENINFDSQETYRFGVDLNSTTFATNDVQLVLGGDGGMGVGPDSASTNTAPTGVTISWAVSEADNGIEFGVSGLMAAGLIPADVSPSNPFDYTVLFGAGSGTNPGPEDTATLSAQVVPVPAALWLFGSGLLGLIGLARTRRS